MAPTTADLSEFRLYTLPEVHEITGLPLRSLQDGAREERFEHVQPTRGASRRMTKAQIEKLLKSATVPARQETEQASARERYLATAARKGSRRRSA